jgi:hypothetical protein
MLARAANSTARISQGDSRMFLFPLARGLRRRRDQIRSEAADP